MKLLWLSASRYIDSYSCKADSYVTCMCVCVWVCMCCCFWCVYVGVRYLKEPKKLAADKCINGNLQT